MKKIIALMLLALLVLLPSAANAQDGSPVLVSLQVNNSDVQLSDIPMLTNDERELLSRYDDVLIVEMSVQNVSFTPITWSPFLSFVLSDGKTEMEMNLLLTKSINADDYNEWDAGQRKTMYFVFYHFAPTFDVDSAYITDMEYAAIYIPLHA